MGKFNLSSVYTSDNIYSVLKLLKALIDTLDTYSFEEPILDKDGNLIPMDWFKNLYNSIHGDSNGNVEIGKDAHVDGNINVDGQATIGKELNLGSNAFFAKVLSPSNTTTLPAIFVRNDNGSLSAFSFDPNRGYILLWEIFTADNIENEVYTTNRKPFIIDMDYLSNIDTTISGIQNTLDDLHYYILDATTLDESEVFGVVYISDFQYEDNTDCIVFGKVEQSIAEFTINGIIVFNNGETYYAKDAFITGSTGELHNGIIKHLNSYLNKYFRHTISIVGAGVFGSFDFYNTDNTPIDSPQDLTTYLKPTTNSKYPCYCLTTDNPPNATQMNCIVYTNNVWKFATKTNTANIVGPSITTVSDIVTAVS